MAIGAAIGYFSEKNIPVLLPVVDCEKYDLAIESDGIIRKVQCKYTSLIEPSGAYNVDLRTFGGYREKTYFVRYKKGDFDLLFVYCGNGDKYLIPAEKVITKAQIAVGSKSWKEFKC